MKTLSERFWAKVNKGGPLHPILQTCCWLWTGAIHRDGYGLIDNLKAHRVSFWLEHGHWPTPCGLHRCDVRSCVRPSHIFEGTQKRNLEDMVSKGRSLKGEKRSIKLTASQVAEIRSRILAGEVQASLAREFKVSKMLVHFIHKGKRW